jgi:hypothetical protein
VVGPFAEVTAIAGTRVPTAAYRDNGAGGIYWLGNGRYVATVLPGIRSYAVNPQTGTVAAIDQNGTLIINAVTFALSPSSVYGPSEFKKITGVTWSPDGRFLAFRVERPDARDGRFAFGDTIDDGIWVWDVAANTTRQVFRNEYRQGAPNQQIAYDFGWANDSQTLIIYVSPDLRNVKLVRQDHDLNRQ